MSTATQNGSAVEQTRHKADEQGGSLQFGLAACGAAVVQGACVFLMLGNSLKVLLGIGGVTAAARSTFLHSDPVRIPLMICAAVCATITLYVIWNGWRLRNRPEAQWRVRPLTRRERWNIGIALGTSILSLSLVIGEFYAHGILHPK